MNGSLKKKKRPTLNTLLQRQTFSKTGSKTPQSEVRPHFAAAITAQARAGCYGNLLFCTRCLRSQAPLRQQPLMAVFLPHPPASVQLQFWLRGPGGDPGTGANGEAGGGVPAQPPAGTGGMGGGKAAGELSHPSAAGRALPLALVRFKTCSKNKMEQRHVVPT